MDIRLLVPTLVFVGGLYFLIRFRFFFGLWKKKEKRPRGSTRAGLSSLMLALAGTIGVGNVFGVATAIIIGGAGSVVWLLFSSIFAAVIKYAEAALSLGLSSENGMISVIRKSFGALGKPLSRLYAAVALALAVVMGFALQGGSISQTAALAFGTPTAISSFVVVILVLYIVLGKGKKIKNFTLILIPLTTIIYIIMTLSIIFSNFSRIGDVLSLVLSDAFSPDSALGGVLGFITSKQIREGFCGGILSNEAGAGTSSFAHTSGENIGAFGGVLEVLFDTVILCMLTALSILLAVPDVFRYSSGAELVLAAVYSTLGGGGIGALLFVVTSFAICTVVCWYYYGAVCYRELFGVEAGRGFLWVLAFSLVFGANVGLDALAVISHYLLLFLSLISVSALIKNSDRIVKTTLPVKMKSIIKDVSVRATHRQARKASAPPPKAQPRSFLKKRTKAPRRSQ